MNFGGKGQWNGMKVDVVKNVKRNEQGNEKERRKDGLKSRTGQERTGKDRTGQERTGQVRTEKKD